MSTQLISPYLRLDELISRLRAWEEEKIDFVAHANHLRFAVREGARLWLRPVENAAAIKEWLVDAGLPLNDKAISHLAQKLSPAPPTPYLRELIRTNGDVAEAICNRTLPQKKLFVRCLCGNVRAILSDSYRVMDHLDIAQWALQATKEAGGEPISANLTDSHMRITITSRQVFDRLIDAERNAGLGAHHWTRFGNYGLGGSDAEPGVCHPVATISNSETGDGLTEVSYGILLARCANTAVIEQAVRRVHLGSRMDLGIFRQDTANAEAMAMRLKIRDAIQAGLHPNTFQRMVDMANGAQQRGIERPRSAAENILKAAGVASGENAIDALLEHFMRDYDATDFGMAQAVSRFAQDQTDGEDVAALENMAGVLIKTGVPRS